MEKDDGGAVTFLLSLIGQRIIVHYAPRWQKQWETHSFALLTCYRQSKKKDDCGISVIIAGQPLQARPAKTDGRGFKALRLPGFKASTFPCAALTCHEVTWSRVRTEEGVNEGEGEYRLWYEKRLRLLKY